MREISRVDAYLAYMETLEMPTVGRISQSYTSDSFARMGLPEGVYPEGVYGFKDEHGSTILIIPDPASIERLIREHGAFTEEDWLMLNAVILLEAVK